MATSGLWPSDLEDVGLVPGLEIHAKTKGIGYVRAMIASGWLGFMNEIDPCIGMPAFT